MLNMVRKCNARPVAEALSIIWGLAVVFIVNTTTDMTGEKWRGRRRSIESEGMNILNVLLPSYKDEYNARYKW